MRYNPSPCLELTPVIDGTSIMKSFATVAITTFSFALSGCAWFGPSSYTLITPMASTANAAKTADFALNVLPVGIPPQLDSRNIVVRRGSTQTEVLTSKHWTTPFGDEVRTAISLQLANELHAQDIMGLQTSAWSRVVDVKLQIRRFDSWPGQSVAINAAWSATLTKDGGNNPVLICSETISQPAPGGLSTIVGAQQAAVQTLARKMSAEIQAWITSGRNDCAN